MVRLRSLGAEFHSPADFREGAVVAMPYLSDMEAYQEYQDGSLDRLFGRMRGNAAQRDLTGAMFYDDVDTAGGFTEAAGNGAYWQVNLFQAITRYFLAAVFDKSPSVIDGAEDVQKRWENESPRIIRQARKACEWYVSKGRGILTVENRLGGPVAQAVDPQFYIPLVDVIDRDLVIGNALLRRWFAGPRLQQTDYANRVTLQIYITEDEAALSDGRVSAQNTVQTFYWSGQQGPGVLGSTPANTGQLGERAGEVTDNARLAGLWTWGNDDSIYKSAERNIYEVILAFTHSRSSMTRDVRALRIDPANKDPNTKLSRLRPTYQIDVTPISTTGSPSIGYVVPPGYELSQGFRELASDGLDNLSYASNTPREAFGIVEDGIEQHEGALSKVQQIFKTWVEDTRDDLSRILSEIWPMLGGPEGVIIGWTDEPFARPYQDVDTLIKLHQANAISTATMQSMLRLPVEEVNNNAGSEREGMEQTGNQPD